MMMSIIMVMMLIFVNAVVNIGDIVGDSHDVDDEMMNADVDDHDSEDDVEY